MKLILTDCDGVLLNWQYAFDCWMEEKGYVKIRKHNWHYYISEQYGLPKDKSAELVRQFLESAAVGFLPAQRDAVQYVRQIHKEFGYKFTVISSISKDKYAQRLRIQNLNKLFGEEVFHDFILLDTGEDKTEALSKFKDSQNFWVEDKTENAIVGHSLGLRSILMEHGYNMHEELPFPIVENWNDIYNIIKDIYNIQEDE